MRRTVIASSLAVVSLAGLVGGIAYATEPGASPAAPTTTAVAGMDVLSDLGLSQDQLLCLASSFGEIDVNDSAAMSDLMTQCGITVDQLLQINQLIASTLPVETTTAAVASVAPVEIDAETAAAVLAVFGLDKTAVDCLVGQAATLPPDDDAAAEAVFIACGVGPAQILAGVVALDAAAAGEVVADTTDTTVAGAPPSTTGNAMLDFILAQLASRGINLDAEQGQCLLDNISDLDPTDAAASLDVFETCGIDITELVSGG
jgi:hypothetical protein